MDEKRTASMWYLTPEQVEMTQRLTRIAFRVVVVCAAVFVLCLMFVSQLPRPVYLVATTLAEFAGMIAAFFAISGFVLDPRVRDFLDVDNPAYRREQDE